MATVLSTDPETLQQAIEFLADDDRCHAYMVRQRWPNGVTCPTCGSSKVGFIATRRVFECRGDEKHARKQFTAKKGTIFEDSAVPLKSWLLAMWMMVNCKNGVSSYEISRAIGVTQKATWHMLHRIRLAMQEVGGGKLGGEIEVDETYIGGKARNMHAAKRHALMTTIRLDGKPSKANRWAGKTPVLGILQRGSDGKSRVRTMPVSNVRKHELQSRVRENVEAGSQVFTDALHSYHGLREDFQHEAIDHAECYARENVHTNGLESFWSLLKRTLGGTYISVEPFHLFRYLDEQARRFNEREMTDGQRFRATLTNVIGKRLTWAELTAKDGDACTA